MLVNLPEKESIRAHGRGGMREPDDSVAQAERLRQVVVEFEEARSTAEKAARQTLGEVLSATLERKTEDHLTAAVTISAQAAMHHEPALRVLLAEDNPVNQKVAVRMLSKLGFQADVASNGMEVLRALESRPYDVVLMDVMMPVMDGLEATRQILERYPQERRPRIIALTANAMRGDRERCLDAGMDDYLAKPLRVEPLKESLSACIPNHESSDAPASNGEHSSGSEPSEDGVGGDGANAAVEPAVPAVDPRTLRELRDMLGGNDPTFLATIIGEYLADADELLATIRSAVSGRRASALQHAAHTLKSSSAMFGASVMAATCSELERLGAENRLDTAPARLQLLERQYDAVRNYLDARMKQAGVS